MARQHFLIGRWSGVAAAGLLALVPGLAMAAEGVCDGVISGQSLAPIPDKSFDIEIYDNSEANLELRQRFLKALREAGKPVADGGPLMISVISERLFPYFRPDTSAVGTPTTSATTDQLGVNRTRSTIEQLERAPREGSDAANRRYAELVDVRFEVRDAETREFVWLGQLSCNPLTDNRTEIVDAVFEAFIENVGKSVSSAPL